ncbi:hypothetical protein MGN70_003353 [Eutypa lata]|nr:hypothetical protein MGN70_003353 [Eutypa lata]
MQRQVRFTEVPPLTQVILPGAPPGTSPQHAGEPHEIRRLLDTQPALGAHNQPLGSATYERAPPSPEAQARLVHAGVVNGISECLHGFREIEAGFRAVMLSRRSSMTPAWDSVVKIG